MEAHLFMMSI